MWKKMNLPNKLTMIRIILVPLFVLFMALPKTLVWNLWVALGIFIVAALTDFIDGKIARSKNLITKFGKIMDPLADKMLVSAGFIMLSYYGIIPGWISAIIILRDFFVNALRIFGADKNNDLSASVSGKVKTACELFSIPLAIISMALGATNVYGAFFANSVSMTVFSLIINIFMTVFVSLAVLATVWSLVDYIVRFKDSVNVEE